MSRFPSAPRRHAVALAASLGLGAVALAACRSGEGDDLLRAPIVSAGDTYAVTSTGRLISFNRAEPGTIRTSIGTGVANVVGGDTRPNGNRLYVLSRATDGTGTLTVIDPDTGATVGTPVTLVRDTTDTTEPYTALAAGARFGVDFNPVVDRLRVVSETGQNLRINVDTGTVITDGAINPAGTRLVSAGYTNNRLDACATQLLVLNAADGNLYLQDPPNNGTVGTARPTGLGAFAGTDRVTFDIRTSNARADEGVVVKNASVYGINTATGATTLRGTLPLAAGETVTALFATGAPAGTTDTGTAAAQQGGMLAILGANVVTFNAGTPQKACSTAPLTGLTAGETVLGVDYRPSNGMVYGLTSGAKLFTLNPFTGVATNGATLAADPADMSSPYTAGSLAASADYGVDFNPVPDRLRVVSSSGQNLRINVDTGATTTDANLNVASGMPTVTAAAYTNSAPLANPTTPTMPFAAPTATTLYDIDSGNSNLYQQNPPNDGVLVLVGPLGVTGGRLNGFDIVSTRSATDPTTQTNIAYAALTVGGVTNLYTVNITAAAGTTGAGAATLVNRIGDGTATVRGLTRAR